LAELVLLPFDRAEIATLHRASINGEPEAVRFFETLWQDYRDKVLVCFLCDRVIPEWEFPPHCAIVGDIADPRKGVGWPLHECCRDLPQKQRCMRLLRAMHKARTGKNVHCVFSPPPVRFKPRILRNIFLGENNRLENRSRGRLRRFSGD
jgi:hypothetical protein